MRRAWVFRAFAAAGVGGLALAGLLIPASPASANTEKIVTLNVGQTVKMTLTDLAGDDASGVADYEAGSDSAGATPTGQDPAGCDGPSNPSCDDIPITLNVPKSALTANNNLFLQTTFTYDEGPQVTAPNGVYQTTNTIVGWMWENPIPTTGPNADTYDANCGNDPCEEGVASPQVAHFDLILDQQTGAADQASVVISLVNVASGASSGGSGSSAGSGSSGGTASSGGPGASGSTTTGSPSSGIGTGASGPIGPAGSSTSPAGAIGPTGPTGSTAPASNPALPLPQYSVDQGGPDAALAALADSDFASALGIGGGQSIRNGQFFGVPPSRPASRLAVILSLTVGPFLLVLLVGWLAIRRRSGSGALSLARPVS